MVAAKLSEYDCSFAEVDVFEFVAVCRVCGRSGVWVVGRVNAILQLPMASSTRTALVFQFGCSTQKQDVGWSRKVCVEA